MSKIKGIRIGSGFVLTEEKEHFKIQSVSGNFSMRVDSTLPFYVACKEAMNHVFFRSVLHDIITMAYFPVSIEFNPERYKRYIEFLNGFVEYMQKDVVPATDGEQEEALKQVKEEYEMREKLGK